MLATPETEPRAVGDGAARIRQLEQQVDTLQQEAAEGAAQLAAAQAEIAALRQRVQELERSAGLNSGKPPSTDGLGKPPTKPKRTQSLRGRSGKRSGGQPGHKGHTLRPKANPDHVEDHWPGQCQDCGAELAAADQVGEPVRRQVFDLPAPAPLEATEHRAHACLCGECGTQTRAAFPEGVNAPTQYGPRISAVAVYLQNQHFVPEQRLAEILLDLFGVKVSTGTVAAMTRKAAERWADFAAQVRDLLRSTVPVKHLDETGFRIAGRLQWLHVICTSLLTFYYVGPARGAVLGGLRGCLVHDHWQTYFKRPGVLHALCNAHHLRELKALAELDGEGWARRMQQLLQRACRAVRLARARGDPLPASLLARILRRYDQLVAQALAYHRGLEPLPSGRRGRKKRRKGHNLALRLRDRQLAVLRFLVDFRVPFTNNQAEQDMRMMKLRMKISGCFRTARGARDFALLRSVLSTARKQGWNRIETLMKTPDELLAALRV